MSGHHHHGHGSHGHGAQKAVSVTLIVNLCITAAKWFAFAVTRSPSLFGEAAHSTADSCNPLVLWLGLRRSSRPAHDRHPQGHGREAYFWSLIAAQLMLLVGAVLTAWHGIETILTGTVPRMSTWALVIMGCAAIGESYSLLVVWRHMRHERAHGGESKNPLTLALLVENGADVLGVLLALAGYGLYVLTGNALWDAGFSLAIAALLATTSLFLINRNRSLIIGETAGPEVEKTVREAIEARPMFFFLEGITTVMRGLEEVEVQVRGRCNCMWFHSKSDINENIAMHINNALRQQSEEIEALKAEIRKRAPRVTRVIVEIQW